jgi:hypothetical protein
MPHVLKTKINLNYKNIQDYVLTYIYIYMCVCVCVCVLIRTSRRTVHVLVH